MIDNIDELIEGTRHRVEEMRRLTEETDRLLGETKKAEAELDTPTAHIQDRQKKAKPAA
jgi:hypothetical protein